MKLLFVVGGGGHFAAAQAVIDHLPKDTDLLVVGRKYAFEGDKALSFEYQEMERQHIPFVTLESGRLQRTFTRHTVPSLARIPKGINQALSILTRFKPDVVVSFGGYIALPVVFAAAFKKIPVVLHEQTFSGGLANKFAARFATKICLSWKESQKVFPKEKSILTGNPVNAALAEVARKKQSTVREFVISHFKLSSANDPILFVTGGSGGSHLLNVWIEAILPKLLETYIVIHQTGDAQAFGDFDRLSTTRDALSVEMKKRYFPMKFLTRDEIASVLKASDVVVGRSGVNTVTALLVLETPAVLIPIISGQKNEQLANATFLARLGLAQVVRQDQVTPELLLAEIEKVLHNKKVDTERLSNFSERALHAPVAILRVIIDVYQQTSSQKEAQKK